MPAHRRVIAALGRQVLTLSARRCAGAHPYLNTPEHTAQARALMGPQALLVPEHKAMLTIDVTQARELGRQALDMYLGLGNYVNNRKRLGFNDDDLRRPVTDRLVDEMIAYGTSGEIAARLTEHLLTMCRSGC